MHPRTYSEFEWICSTRGATGRVLEIGATPHPNSLLCMKALEGASEKIGLNLDGPSSYRDFEIVRGNANAMEFDDDSFDVVVCNAVLEHDPFFWKTLSEIRRVTRPGGLVVIGTPGYTQFPSGKTMSGAKQFLINVLFRFKFLDRLYWFLKSTPTIEIHNAPGDYYRFSPQAFREVFFEGMVEVEVRPVLFPPIIVGSGRMPTGSGG